MKLQGKVIEGPNVEEIIIPRGDSELVFQAQAILDWDEFEALCPKPTPGKVINRKGQKVEDLKSKTYQTAMQEWAERRVAFMVVKGLEATEGLEWDTVDLSKVNTWLNYKTELKNAGFTEAEQVRLLNGVLAANGLDESKVEAARQRFLLTKQEESSPESSQEGELNSSQSGELASE